MSMGSYRLATIITEMQNDNKYKGKLLIPNPGNYHTQHSFKHEKTIWLITDRSISSGQIKNPGQNRYYICYEQTLKNGSPFFYFDENKPAWKSHTTLPHSLTAALLNASRPLLKDGKICDPFGGTGTTWLETKRLQLKNQVYCSDISPATKVLISDNLKFFLLSLDELIQLDYDLESCHPTKSLSGQFKITFNDDKITLDPYTNAKQFLDTLKQEQKDEDQEFVLSESFVADFIKLPFLTRIVFYIGLRAELRYQAGFKRKSITFEAAYNKSLDNISNQIKMFIDLKEKVDPNKGLINSLSKDPY